MQLQESYGNDRRFRLDHRFQGDIELEKLPKNLKPEEEKAPDELDQEKELSLKILGEIVPSANRFIGKGTGATRLIQRFDPTRPNDNLVQLPGEIQQEIPAPRAKMSILDQKDTRKPFSFDKKDSRKSSSFVKKDTHNKKNDKKKHSKSKPKKSETSSAELRKKAPRRKVQATVQISSDYLSSSTETSQFKLFG